MARIEQKGDLRVDQIMPELCPSWVMMPFEECLHYATGRFKKLKKKDIKTTGRIPVIDQGETFVSGYIDNETDAYEGSLPVIIFGDHTRRIKFIDFPFAVGADGTKILKPIEYFNPKFFYYYLRSLNLESQGYSRHYRFLKQTKVPIPSHAEQRRIVAKLEKILAKVNACKERLEKIPAILKRFRQSVLTAACSGRLTANWRSSSKETLTIPMFRRDNARGSNNELPTTWDNVRSADLFSFVTSGSRGWARYYSHEGPLFVRVGNLSHETISLDLRSVQRVKPPPGAEGFRTRVLPNDILISITADVGMVALARDDIEEAYINQHVALARPKSGFCTNFVAWYLSSSEGGLKQFQEMQRGATKVGLGLDDIKNVLVPFPPLEEQHEIVHRVEALFKIADEIEKRYQKAKAHVDKLTQSILAKAFRGELVPQDPNDEPASELLKRIQAERKNQDAEARPGRRFPRRKLKTMSGTL